jgi:hypothetical protein
MKYFVQVLADNEAFWQVHHDKAERIDVSASRTWTAAPGEDAITMLRKTFPLSDFHELFLGPGEYYPRMDRPSSTCQKDSPGSNPDKSDTFRHAGAASMGQLQALIEQLERICRIIHPVNENFQAFGHETRNVLILACTEIEAQWKNILKYNRVEKDRTSTKDYVVLLEAMKLNEYEVTLTYYPWLKPVKPFKEWCDKCPTQSLEWYDAYNRVKHNREEMFGDATLNRAILAVTGCFVMLCAQYGWDFALKDEAARSAFFRLTGAPKWAPSEIYPPYGAYKAVPYPFDKLSAS